MNSNKKIQAFTLSEMLIVLVITAIVIGIAFSVLTLITKQYNAMKDSYIYKSEVLKLKQRLSIDFNSSQNIVWNPNEEQLIITSSEQRIIYQWDVTAIIRNSDTIALGVSQSDLFQQGQPVLSGPIDGLRLICDKGGINTSIFVSRETDALTNMTSQWD